MESRAGFKQVSEFYLRSTAPNTIDTGIIPPPVGVQESNRGLRGVEQNTARGVKTAPLIIGITAVEYGTNTDAPVVDHFKVYGDN